MLQKLKYNLKEIKGHYFISLCKTDKIIGTNIYVTSIITNLISNAIKYASADRKLEINIITQIENGYLLCIIADNGIGIELNLHKEKVFKMFNRFHNHSEGRGMGLFMVKNMVEKIGGSIEIESEVDKGTKFKIKFKIPHEKIKRNTVN